MTDLAQIALEFCRECLGWEDARLISKRQWIGYNWQIDPSDPTVSGSALFDYTDLSAVMEAVSDWAFKMNVFVHLHIAVGRYSATVSERGATSASAAAHNNACHALLAACLEANRKLKATA